MDELIERAARGEARADDVETLAAWRRASIGNEQHYRRTMKLLEQLRSTTDRATRVPSIETILKRPRAPRQPKPRRQLLVSSLVGAGLVLVFALSFVIRRFEPGELDTVSVPGDGVGYATGPAELATVQLSDGSVVRLAPSTKLRFVQTRDAREATLDGRAFFSVSHIPGRAFHVRTRLGDATVLGTRFELSTGEKDLTLIVVSGRVSLVSATKAIGVPGGQQSAVRDGTILAPQPVPNAETMEEWIGKFLAFQETPISEVAREIAETYGIRVIVADSALAGRTVKGTFTDRDAKHVLEAVCSAVHARCESRSGEVVMTSR
jgi:ferric-dicitrate binding protein FerR (iron transport regulator)